ncbi:MAG: beta-lactamase family protein [Acidobacteriia bacterium]|nr:beta-lactamase family protein [Terriglobia bacterium]
MKLAIAILALASVASAQSVDFSPIDRLMNESLDSLGGSANLLLIRNGKVIYRKSFGKFTPDTVVPIASASKWISASVVMRLVEKGKLSLEDPVSKYFPNAPADKAKITLRQLFAFTGGFPFQNACMNNHTTMTLEKCANEILAAPLQIPAGTGFIYSGASMMVGGRMAEIATGKDWNTLFREEIAEPLGMTATAYEEMNPRVPGGAHSNMDDYGKLLAMILNHGVHNGRRILEEKTLIEMRTDQSRGVPIRQSPNFVFASLDPEIPKTRYGIGEWLDRMDENGRGIEVSSTGAFGYVPWIDLKFNLAGVLLVQSTYQKSTPVYVALKKALHQILQPASF